MRKIICIFLDLLSNYSYDYKIKFNILLITAMVYSLILNDYEFLLEVINIAVKFNCQQPTN